MIESFHMHQEKEVKDEPFLYCCWSRDHASLDPPLLWRRPFQNCCAFTKGKLQHPTGKGSTGLDSAVETQGLGTFPWGWRQKAGEAAELIWPPNIRPPFFHSSHIFVSACGHPERRLLLSGSSGVDSDHVTPSRLVGWAEGIKVTSRTCSRRKRRAGPCSLPPWAKARGRHSGSWATRGRQHTGVWAEGGRCLGLRSCGPPQLQAAIVHAWLIRKKERTSILFKPLFKTIL